MRIAYALLFLAYLNTAWAMDSDGSRIGQLKSQSARGHHKKVSSIVYIDFEAVQVVTDISRLGKAASILVLRKPDETTSSSGSDSDDPKLETPRLRIASIGKGYLFDQEGELVEDPLETLREALANGTLYTWFKDPRPVAADLEKLRDEEELRPETSRPGGLKAWLIRNIKRLRFRRRRL